MVQIFKNQNRSVLNSNQLPPDPFQLLTNNKNNKPALSQNGLLNAELPTATTGSNLLNQPTGFASSTPGRAFATAIGQASGYSDRPVSFTEVLSQGMAARNKAQASQAALEQQKFNDNRTYNLALGDAYTNRIKALNTDGRINLEKQMDLLHPNLIKGTPEYLKQAMNIMESGSTKFGQNIDDIIFQEQYKKDVATVGGFLEKANNEKDLTNAYAVLEKIIESNPDMKTGPLTETILPFKQLALELGMLTKEEGAIVDAQKLIQAYASFLTPRMRPVGSGASSDFEQKLYGQATLQLSNSQTANLLLVKARGSYARMNVDYALFADQYLRKNPKDFNFGDLDEAYNQALFSDRGRFERIMGTKNIFDGDDQMISAIKNGNLKEGDLYLDNDRENITFGSYLYVNENQINAVENEVEK